MTINATLLVETIQTLGWMIAHFKWEHEESGLGGDYSPELKKAIEIHQKLRGMCEE